MSRSDELWHLVPAKSRAATLIILFDTPEEKHVILTVRSLSLRSFPGQAALPGGRAEPGEDWWAAGLREATEEIGFDPEDFETEKVVAMPAHFSRNHLIVRPCVVSVRKRDGSPVALREIAKTISNDEVQCVFSIPLRHFLTAQEADDPLKSEWAGNLWYFYRFPFEKTEWLFGDDTDPSSIAETAVTGLTAHILIDAARFIYREAPSFAHLPDLGFEQGVEFALSNFFAKI